MVELLSIGAVGLAVGFALAWFVRASRAQLQVAPLQARLDVLEQQAIARQRDLDGAIEAHTHALDRLHRESQLRATIEERAARLPALEAKLEERDNSLSLRDTRVATLEAQLIEERKTLEEQRRLLKDAQTALTDSFKALSADALKSNSQSFILLAKATLEKYQETAKGDLEARQKAVHDLVNPLRESLHKVDSKLGDIEKERVASYSALNAQLKGLVETHLPVLRNETANLVKALRQPTTRGRWGELQLKRVVEMAGMLDHCDFLEQENRTLEDGKLRPDLVVKLPGGRNIVVDAKAPVSAYLEALETSDEAMQRAHLSRHAQQVRGHMTALGRKAYWDQFEPTPELVIMFLPGEVFFSAALQEDPSLIEAGVNEKVVVATPTTLIALLRAVAYGWRQEALAKNAKEIALLGKDLYTRIATLAEHWNKVGERLGRTVEAYNKSTGSLETSVLRPARKLRDLKVGADDAEIVALETVTKLPRSLQAEEFVGQVEEEEA